MLGELWRRPSIAVVLCAAAVVTVFVVRGDLGLESAARSREVPTTAKGHRAPVVVRPERGGRSRAEAPAPVSVTGRVFDSLGFLVVGAEVSAPGQPVVRTDADGSFTALVPSAHAPLLVRARGLQAKWVPANLGGPDPLLVQLAPAAPWDVEPAPPEAAAASLVGEGVVRGVDGKPLAGAFVTAVGSDRWSRTDDIGRYVLQLPSPNSTLVVHHPDASGEGRGQAVRSLELQLPRTSGIVPLPELVASLGSALRGTLRDGRGNPVVGAPLQVRGEGLSRIIESGISGMFRIAGLLPGRYEVRPLGFRGALGRGQEVVVDASFVDCEVHLQPTDERQLQILDEAGAPVPRAYVAMAFGGERCGVAQADADGRMAIRVGDEADFEVRGADGLVELTVRRYEPASGQLVVAAP